MGSVFINYGHHNIQWFIYFHIYIYMKKNIYLYTYIQIIINGKVEEMRQNHRLFMNGNLMLGDLKYISRFF